MIMNWLQADMGSVFGVILYVLIVIGVTLVVALVAKRLFRMWIRRIEARGGKEQIVAGINLLRRIVVGLIYLGGAMAVVGQVPGLNNITTSLLAGSGIAAVALSVAAQASIGNLVSGALIGVFKPFRVGDIIRYLDQNITGIVEEITLRHTIIRTFENNRLIIPNSTMNTEVIENASYGSGMVCLFLDLEVACTSDLELAIQILEEQVRRHPRYLDVRTEADKENDVPEVLVRVQKFSTSGITIRAFVWAADAIVAAQMKSDILRSTKKEYEKAGIEIPYLYQAVVIRNKMDHAESLKG
ncbi:MAG: mechanosensitive ion channel family protein [Oscillospiraceae bacterium]